MTDPGFSRNELDGVALARETRGDRLTNRIAAAAAAATWALAVLLGPPVSPLDVGKRNTPEYVAVADDLGSESARARPPLFPLLIRLCRSIAGEGWPDFLVFVQIGMLGGLAAVLFRSLRRNGLRADLAFVTAVASCTTPSLILYSRLLLPEVLMAVLVALAWNATLRSMDGRSSFGGTLVAAGFAGILSGAAALTKPVWLLGAFPLALGILIAGKSNAAIRRRAALILVAGHAAVILSWQAFLFHQFGQLRNSRVGTINVNLAAIRLGMTHFGVGTPLYRHLESAGLLDTALRLRYEDWNEFARIKNAIPYELRTDVEFQKKVVLNHFGVFLVRQLPRVPTFFFVRPAEQSHFRTGSGPIGAFRSLHRLAYGFYFRIRLGPLTGSPCLLLLFVGAAWSIRSPEYRGLFWVSLLCLGSFALATVLLTYQDSILSRLRVEVEPVLLLVTLLPLCGGIEWLRRARSSHRNEPLST